MLFTKAFHQNDANSINRHDIFRQLFQADLCSVKLTS